MQMQLLPHQGTYFQLSTVKYCMVVIGETNIVTIFQWERTLHTPIGTQPAQKVAINSPRVLLHVNVRQQRIIIIIVVLASSCMSYVATPRPPNLPVLLSKQTQKMATVEPKIHLISSPSKHQQGNKEGSIHPSSGARSAPVFESTIGNSCAKKLNT
jgi:hypothetical protein